MGEKSFRSFICQLSSLKKKRHITGMLVKIYIYLDILLVSYKHFQIMEACTVV